MTPSSTHNDILKTLQARFEKHMHRHKGMKWDAVAAKLEKNPKKLESLQMMEETGGEPDVVTLEKNAITFVDCAPESPKGRRSCCFDTKARTSRKEHPPKTSAEEMADDMGVEILNEEQYRALQELEAVDLKTSSWVATPADIRKLGGALFCDRRYGTVFTYHNGADSYYAARGWRGILKI